MNRSAVNFDNELERESKEKLRMFWEIVSRYREACKQVDEIMKNGGREATLAKATCVSIQNEYLKFTDKFMPADRVVFYMAGYKEYYNMRTKRMAQNENLSCEDQEVLGKGLSAISLAQISLYPYEVEICKGEVEKICGENKGMMLMPKSNRQMPEPENELS